MYRKKKKRTCTVNVQEEEEKTCKIIPIKV